MYSLSGCCFFTVVTVMMVVMGFTNLKLVYELPSFRCLLYLDHF